LQNKMDEENRGGLGKLRFLGKWLIIF